MFFSLAHLEMQFCFAAQCFPNLPTSAQTPGRAVSGLTLSSLLRFGNSVSQADIGTGRPK